MSFKYTAVDSIMIHICIYIFTINHFVDTFLKNPHNLAVLITEWPWSFASSLMRKICSMIITFSFSQEAKMWMMAYTFTRNCSRDTLCCWTSSSNSAEEQIPSSSSCWLCWYLVHRFSFRSLYCDKRAPCSQKTNRKSEDPTHWITNKSLINALHFLLLNPFLFSLRRFNPSRHGMVSPHRLSVTKDWPEYKNIISFLKRRTQTWFNGKKKKSFNV